MGKTDFCHNGCCQSTPCQNGGTCHEVCGIKVRRYKCACLPGYSGHKCHKKLQSCHDILTSGRHTNGVYQIRDETNSVQNIFCDFESEPGMAWTLVQSYSLEKGQMRSKRDIFSRRSLLQDFPVNESFPTSWPSYRLSLAAMQSVRVQSSHWRATCDFPEIGVDFRDYDRASLDAFDVMDSFLPSYSCRRYEFINIRGNQCVDCTAYTGTLSNYQPFILSYFSKYGSCEFDGRPNGNVISEFNFGIYFISNPAFRCSATKNSTTQLWLGRK